MNAVMIFDGNGGMLHLAQNRLLGSQLWAAEAVFLQQNAFADIRSWV